MSDPMYDGICEPRERIHRGARHALHDDPWRAEKVAQAVEVERRLDAAQKSGKRQAVRLQANREARRAA